MNKKTLAIADLPIIEVIESKRQKQGYEHEEHFYPAFPNIFIGPRHLSQKVEENSGYGFNFADGTPPYYGKKPDSSVDGFCTPPAPHAFQTYPFKDTLQDTRNTHITFIYPAVKSVTDYLRGKDSRAPIYFVCQAGRSRSASVAAAFIMLCAFEKYKWVEEHPLHRLKELWDNNKGQYFDQAQTLIQVMQQNQSNAGREKDNVVNPNPGFIFQLGILLCYLRNISNTPSTNDPLPKKEFLKLCDSFSTFCNKKGEHALLETGYGFHAIEPFIKACKKSHQAFVNQLTTLVI